MGLEVMEKFTSFERAWVVLAAALHGHDLTRYAHKINTQEHTDTTQGTHERSMMMRDIV